MDAKHLSPSWICFFNVTNTTRCRNHSSSVIGLQNSLIFIFFKPFTSSKIYFTHICCQLDQESLIFQSILLPWISYHYLQYTSYKMQKKLIFYSEYMKFWIFLILYTSHIQYNIFFNSFFQLIVSTCFINNK